MTAPQQGAVWMGFFLEALEKLSNKESGVQ